MSFSGLCRRASLISLVIHQDVIQPRFDAGYCLLEKRTHAPFWLLCLRILRHRGRITVLEIGNRLLSGKCLVSHSHGFGGGCARTSTCDCRGGCFQSQFDNNSLDVSRPRRQWQGLAAMVKRERECVCQDLSRIQRTRWKSESEQRLRRWADKTVNVNASQ